MDLLLENFYLEHPAKTINFKLKIVGKNTLDKKENDDTE